MILRTVTNETDAYQSSSIYYLGQLDTFYEQTSPEVPPAVFAALQTTGAYLPVSAPSASSDTHRHHCCMHASQSQGPSSVHTEASHTDF